MTNTKKSHKYVHDLLSSRISFLSKKLEELQEEYRTAVQAMREHDAGPLLMIDASDVGPAASNNLRYADMSYTQASLLHLKEVGVPQSTVQVADALVAGGIKIGKNPRATTYSALRRLATDGDVEKSGGRWQIRETVREDEDELN